MKGLVVKTHGNSKAIEVKNSIIQCISFKEMNINDKISKKLAVKKGELKMEIERLYKAVASVLDIDESTITPESKFADDLGADSLDVLEIIMSIEDEFNIKIPTNGAENIVTVGDAFEAIKKVMNK